MTNYVKVSSGLSDTERSSITASSLNFFPRGVNDIMLANFVAPDGSPNNYSGSNFDGDYAGVVSFLVYKRIGNDQTLYKVAEVPASYQLAQDFMVGTGTCQYYIYPVAVDEEGNKIIRNPLTTGQIEIKLNTYAVIGTKATEKINVYNIDYDNIWVFRANIEESDYTMQMGKVFTEGLGKFPKETITKKWYWKGGASSLIGSFDNNHGCRYKESTELEKAWEVFCHNGELKIIKDLDGRMIPGDIDSFSYKTNTKVSDRVTTIAFTYVQLADMDSITVMSDNEHTIRQKYPILTDCNGIPIQGRDGRLLCALAKGE